MASVSTALTQDLVLIFQLSGDRYAIMDSETSTISYEDTIYDIIEGTNTSDIFDDLQIANVNFVWASAVTERFEKDRWHYNPGP